MSGSLILRKKHSLSKFKELFIFVFIITFLGNCTKEIISSRNTSEFSFSSIYFEASKPQKALGFPLLLEPQNSKKP